MTRYAFECNECGARFKRALGPNTFEVRCPKCHGYDTEPLTLMWSDSPAMRREVA